jgi:hypothetical protein
MSLLSTVFPVVTGALSLYCNTFAVASGWFLNGKSDHFVG